MSRGSGSPRPPFRGTSIRRRCSPPARSSSARRGRSSPARARGPDTSSTWATACSPKRRSRRCRPWWSGCMAAEAEAIAVLLMAYGGPDSLDDVEPYLLDVRGGRPVSPEFAAEIKARYARIGGRSPIRELTEAQAAGVQRLLGDRFAVRVGMRHWHPYIADAVERMVAARQRRLVGIVLAPHYSSMSVGAYQSAGATAEPWLGPEAGALMTDLAGKGHQDFLIVPIGFVCDHVEVLYDVDVVYRGLAGRLGVRLERTASLNDDPLLVAAIAEIAHDTAAGRGWL